MENEERRTKVKKRHPFRDIMIIMLCVITAAFAGMFFLKLQKIEVTGTTYAKEDAVIGTLFPDEASRRLLCVLWQEYSPLAAEKPLDYTLELSGMQEAKIRVMEPEAVMTVPFSGSRLIIGEKGEVIGMTEEVLDHIVSAEGFGVTAYENFNLPEVPEDERDDFLSAISMIKKLGEYEILPESLLYSDGCFTIKIDGIRVIFGSADFIPEKANEIRNQYPYYAGLRGTLHMEDYGTTAEKERFFFEVEP